MLLHPQLALCTDRSKTPKKNTTIGEPLEWLTHNVLNSFGCSQLSFDFFVNWNNFICQDRIWIKRILAPNIDIHDFSKNTSDFITQKALDINDNLMLINLFSIKYNFSPSYMIFKDNVVWETNPEPILRGAITAKGIEDLKLYTINDIKRAIHQNSGGPVKIGKKGLLYGTSSLECYLSFTDAAWPGDVDILLWDNFNNKVSVIIELKKHNLETPISDQQLSNYYPSFDKRKYDRLAILRDRLGSNIPIIVLYYPTNIAQTNIKLELINGLPGKLYSASYTLIDISKLNQEEIGTKIMKSIMDVLSCE